MKWKSLVIVQAIILSSNPKQADPGTPWHQPAALSPTRGSDHDRSKLRNTRNPLRRTAQKRRPGSLAGMERGGIAVRVQRFVRFCRYAVQL